MIYETKTNWERHEENPNKNQTSVTIVIQAKWNKQKLKSGKCSKLMCPFNWAVDLYEFFIYFLC